MKRHVRNVAGWTVAVVALGVVAVVIGLQELLKRAEDKL